MDKKRYSPGEESRLVAELTDAWMAEGKAWGVTRDGQTGTWQNEGFPKAPLYFKSREDAERYCQQVAIGWQAFGLPAEEVLVDEVWYWMKSFDSRGCRPVCFDKTPEGGI